MISFHSKNTPAVANTQKESSRGTKTPGIDGIFQTLPNQVFENRNKLSYCPKMKIN